MPAKIREVPEGAEMKMEEGIKRDDELLKECLKLSAVSRKGWKPTHIPGLSLRLIPRLNNVWPVNWDCSVADRTQFSHWCDWWYVRAYHNLHRGRAGPMYQHGAFNRIGINTLLCARTTGTWCSRMDSKLTISLILWDCCTTCIQVAQARWTKSCRMTDRSDAYLFAKYTNPLHGSHAKVLSTLIYIDIFLAVFHFLSKTFVSRSSILLSIPRANLSLAGIL